MPVGTIGMQAVARSAPDGYTLGFGSLERLAINPTLAINPAIERSIPYDGVWDFAPVISIFESPLFLLVPKDGPHDVAKLVGRLKAGGMSCGSGSPGPTQHIGSELFRQNVGAQAQHVPYRGPGPVLTDLMAGSLGFVMESEASSIR